MGWAGFLPSALLALGPEHSWLCLLCALQLLYQPPWSLHPGATFLPHGRSLNVPNITGCPQEAKFPPGESLLQTPMELVNTVQQPRGANPGSDRTRGARLGLSAFVCAHMHVMEKQV